MKTEHTDKTQELVRDLTKVLLRVQWIYHLEEVWAKNQVEIEVYDRDEALLTRAMNWLAQSKKDTATMKTERTEIVNDRAWWSRLYNLDDEHKVDFIVDAYNAGEITDAQLWETLSSYHGPVSSRQARVIYSKLGYVPFAGYPLEKITSKRGSP